MKNIIWIKSTEVFINGRNLVFKKGKTYKIRPTSFLYRNLYNLEYHVSGPYLETI